MNKSVLRNTVNNQFRDFQYNQSIIDDILTQDKGYVPASLIKRVTLQHTLRQSQAVYPFTLTTKNIVMDLFKLSISQNSKVRDTAQNILHRIFRDYTNSYKLIIPNIIEILNGDTEKNCNAYKVIDLYKSKT